MPRTLVERLHALADELAATRYEDADEHDPITAADLADELLAAGLTLRESDADDAAVSGLVHQLVGEIAEDHDGVTAEMVLDALTASRLEVALSGGEQAAQLTVAYLTLAHELVADEPPPTSP